MPSDTSDVTIPSAHKTRLQADLSLLLVAVIWGSGFVAQRVGMRDVGPFAFNAARFAVGALALVPVLGRQRLAATSWDDVRGGAVLGLLVFVAAGLQQLGLVWTTAGKAGFITGLYIVIVPLLMALVWRESAGWCSWLGASLGAGGLFFLSVEAGLRLAPGDGWVLASALIWALHVIAVGRIVPGRDPLRLAFLQFLVCSLTSLPAALALESGAWRGLLSVIPAITYAGLISIGVGYTTQIVAQRHTRPTHAAIILSTESVFAALSGWWLLGEALSSRQLAGCGLMLAGMVLAQVRQVMPGRHPG